MRQVIGKQNKRYLIVAADDLGRSSSVNMAIAEAYDRGIITASSLMAGGEAFEEAVQIALRRGRLSVGLHLTLCDGRAVLGPSQIPDLVDRDCRFEKSPARAWIKYMRDDILPQLEAEVEAQFERLERAGIMPTHVDGHHHLHMHPRIFKVICRQASKRGIGWIRMPYESLSVTLSPHSLSRGVMPFVERTVFGLLRAHNSRTVRRFGINTASNSLGLSWTGNIDEKYFLCLLGCAKGPINEIFTHPDVATIPGRRELDALTSAGVRSRLDFLDLELVGYRGLSREVTAPDSAWEGI